MGGQCGRYRPMRIYLAKISVSYTGLILGMAKYRGIAGGYDHTRPYILARIYPAVKAGSNTSSFLVRACCMIDPGPYQAEAGAHL